MERLNKQENTQARKAKFDRQTDRQKQALGGSGLGERERDHEESQQANTTRHSHITSHDSALNRKRKRKSNDSRAKPTHICAHCLSACQSSPHPGSVKRRVDGRMRTTKTQTEDKKEEEWSQEGREEKGEGREREKR